MNIVSIKRGASLSLTVGFTNDDGSAYALAGVTLNAQIRDAEENLIASLTPVPTATAGQATLFVQDTSPWPLGLLRMDIFSQAPGGPQAISDTFGIQVLRGVTQTLPEQPAYNPVSDGLAPGASDNAGDQGDDE